MSFLRFSKMGRLPLSSAIFRSSFKPNLLFNRNLFIQTSPTPNDQALKFIPSMEILPANETVEFLSGREAHSSPLALKLFSIDGIRSIMFGSNFITIEKSNELDWSLIKPEIFSILTEYLTNGEPIIKVGSSVPSDLAANDQDDELITMIKELIFTRIKPAIQDDGGDIEFVEYLEDGTVLLKLKGACRTCDSSTITLKNGIESMLKYYIEEVTAVKQVDDDYVPGSGKYSDLTESGPETSEQVEDAAVEFQQANITPRSRDSPPTL